MVMTHSPRRIAVLGALVLAIPLLAGCVDEQPNDVFEARTGSGGHYFTSWDYSAADIQHMMNARMAMEVNAEENTGLVQATGSVGSDVFEVTLTEFNHSSDDFHSGGVAANFDEHGDSGVGNTLLPRMHLLLATWGPAELVWNTAPLVDPYTGNTTYDAHLMVTDTGVRDDSSGKVLKSDGTTPYDPAAPDDAMIGRDNEAHLVLTSRFTGEPLPPANHMWNGQILQPVGSDTFTFPLNTTSAHVEITFDSGSDPQEVGQWIVELQDPGGNVVEETSFSNNRPVETINKTISYSTPGDWLIRVTADTLPADFTADIRVTYPPLPFHYFVWEDVEIVQRVV